MSGWKRISIQSTIVLLALALAGGAVRAQEDDDCLECHGAPGRDGAPVIDLEGYRTSPHARNECIGCHEDAGDDEEWAHGAEDVDLGPVACGECHDDVAEIYAGSVHGQARANGENGHDAATCVDCHGTHDIRKVKDPESRVFPFHLPETCGGCHGDEILAARHNIEIPEAYQQYMDSVHGRGLSRAGLLVSATCGSCHGSHDIQSGDDPRSPVHETRVVGTCGGCHVGVKETYLGSVHGEAWTEGEKQAPICTTCHATHALPEPTGAGFRVHLVRECGTCHADLMETYGETFHGKATEHGDSAVAKCSDCHGHHGILAGDDPLSLVHPDNKLETCRQCHEDAPEGYVGFWAHAGYHDGERYPLLRFVYVFMVGLLGVVFSFFGLHTALWCIRGLIDAAAQRRARAAAGEKPPGSGSNLAIRRFDLSHRVLHLFVISSFIGLALTGAPLKYSEAGWAKVLFTFLGGVQTAGWLHRVFAIVTFGYFFAHIYQLVRRVLVDRTLRPADLLGGPNTLVPGWGDVKGAAAQFRWFLGLGPKPRWDRWTYWEKFDYWAVFWGVAIIGSSGLVMWFPEFFCSFLPGWVVNVSLLIHSEEALLAIGFIFIVHFFNNHLRVEKFPMDPVIFTGSVPEEEFREERPEEYARLLAEGRLDSLRVPPPSPTLLRWAHLAGIAAWMVALALMGLILYGYVAS